MLLTFDKRRQDNLKKLADKTGYEIEISNKKTEVLVEKSKVRKSKSI